MPPGPSVHLSLHKIGAGVAFIVCKVTSAILFAAAFSSLLFVSFGSVIFAQNVWGVQPNLSYGLGLVLGLFWVIYVLPKILMQFLKAIESL